MVTINTMDPVVQWTHNVTLYPTCVTGYTVASDHLSITVDPTVRNLTAEALGSHNFPYCTDLNLTITPLTPMGPLASIAGSSLVTLISSSEYIT